MLLTIVTALISTLFGLSLLIEHSVVPNLTFSSGTFIRSFARQTASTKRKKQLSASTILKGDGEAFFINKTTGTAVRQMDPELAKVQVEFAFTPVSFERISAHLDKAGSIIQLTFLDQNNDIIHQENRLYLIPGQFRPAVDKIVDVFALSSVYVPPVSLDVLSDILLTKERDGTVVVNYRLSARTSENRSLADYKSLNDSLATLLDSFHLYRKGQEYHVYLQLNVSF